LEPISRRINVLVGSTIYETFNALNFPIGALCGGRGSCGKCVIRILDKKAKISAPNRTEIKLLGEDKIAQGYRLACQTKILGDTRIYLGEGIIAKGSRILTHSDLKSLGIESDFEIEPNVIQKKLTITMPTLSNPRNDFWGLIEAIKCLNCKSLRPNSFNSYINNNFYEISKKLPLIMRNFNVKKSNQNNKNTIIGYFRIDNEESEQELVWSLIDIDNYEKESNIFGLAVDIGTTTIVGYLIDLNSGNVSAISALLNPQVALGEDIISRITYIKKYNAQKRAQELLINSINRIIDDTSKKAHIEPSDIRDIAIVGNTAMHHMFFGFPTQYLAVAPFVPVLKNPISISAHNFNLKCNPNTNIYSPPIIAGYIGTDTIGCIVSSKIYDYEKYTLLLDIGTNGELVIGNKYGLTTGSCAAGSALEGAHIKFGMRASEGAIENIKIDPETLEPSVKIIGNVPPIGICGSGFIDLIAEMLKAKIITRAGRINKRNPSISQNKRIVQKDNNLAYIIYKNEWDQSKLEDQGINYKKEEEHPINEIYITQEDIRQIQLAKAAFLSGANIILQNENKNPTGIEQVVLAGAFGNYIDKKNAAFIGLFPDVKQNNIFQIGNAAGLGAQMFIKNVKFRQLANQITNQVKYYEIASSKLFQKEYAYSLYFPHYNIEQFPTLKEFYKDIPFK